MTVKPAKLSDAKLADLGREREQIKKDMGDMALKMSTIDDKIIAELETRGTDVIENSGIRVTRVQQMITTYDWLGLRKKLKPAIRKLCVKEVLDTKGLSACVQQGLVPVELVARYSEQKPKKAYVSVTEIPS